MAETLGRYEVLEKIGEGGFAIVYRARDLELDRLVALKELRSLLLTDTTWVKRFRREAKAIAQLDHPHIATIYDVGEAEGRQFIVMRLVNGSSLDKIIAQRGRLPWTETTQIVTAIADGLAYAHAQGILHRDLKPGNILIDSERGPMLTDFGFAKLAGESSRSVTVSGDIVGTPHYIAPEAWEGQQVTLQADIYALGCIFYEMITGEKLFQGETPPAVMMAHFKPLTLPSTWPEGVPGEITQILTTALARIPTNRYASADKIIEALKALDGDTSVSTITPAARDDEPTEPESTLDVQETSEAEQPFVSTTNDAPSPSETQPSTQTTTAESAKMWQQKAEEALAAGNLEGARSAAYQWQALMPDSPDLATFRRRLEERLQTIETSQPITPPQIVVVKEDRGRRGCLWISAILGIVVVILGLVGLGGLCSTLNTTITNLLPTVEVGQTVEEPIRIGLLDEELTNLEISFGSGALTIRPGAEDALVEGTATYNVSQLKPKITIEDDDVLLRHENPLGLAGFTSGNIKNEWVLRLSDRPIALTIDAGAAKGDIELGGLSLAALEVTQGAANFELNFSEPNRINMETLEFKAGGAITSLTGLANARTESMSFNGGFGDFTLNFDGELQNDMDVTLDGAAGTFFLIIPEGTSAQVSINKDDIDVTIQGQWQQTDDDAYILPGKGPRINIQAGVEGGNLRLRNH